MVIGLDDVAAIVELFHDAGQLTDGLLTLCCAFQVLTGDDPRDQHADDHEEQEDASQLNAVQEHDHQRTDDGADGDDHFQQTGLQDLGDFVQVAGDTAEDLSGLVLVKETKRKTIELFCYLLTQGKREILRYAGHQERLQIIEDPGQKILHAELSELCAHVFPGDGKWDSLGNGRLDALPEMVDHDG